MLNEYTAPLVESLPDCLSDLNRPSIVAGSIKILSLARPESYIVDCLAR